MGVQVAREQGRLKYFNHIGDINEMVKTNNMNTTQKADQLVNDIEDILTKSQDIDYTIEQLAKIVIDEILSNFDTNYDHWFWKDVRKKIVNK